MYYIKHISEHKIVPVKDLELAISVSDQNFYMAICINLRQIRVKVADASLAIS